jgi:hypothetical protein
MVTSRPFALLVLAVLAGSSRVLVMWGAAASVPSQRPLTPFPPAEQQAGGAVCGGECGGGCGGLVSPLTQLETACQRSACVVARHTYMQLVVHWLLPLRSIGIVFPSASVHV